jgi:hypothetical protein
MSIEHEVEVISSQTPPSQESSNADNEYGIKWDQYTLHYVTDDTKDMAKKKPE